MKHDGTQEIKMQNLTDTCARAGDLVAYLYGETNETGIRDFQNHVTGCATCRSELSAFADLREGITAWRNEALNPIQGPTPDAVHNQVAMQVSTKRSALRALREFFTLSPLWLRGATAFAAVLFVALLFVTALHYFDRDDAPIVTQTPSIRRVDAKESPTVPKSGEVTLASSSTNNTSDSKFSVRAQKKRRAESKPSVNSNTNRRESAPVLSNAERTQLSDLLIASNEEEESVPRLYDLLYESN